MVQSLVEQKNELSAEMDQLARSREQAMKDIEALRRDAINPLPERSRASRSPKPEWENKDNNQGRTASNPKLTFGQLEHPTEHKPRVSHIRADPEQPPENVFGVKGPRNLRKQTYSETKESDLFFNDSPAPFTPIGSKGPKQLRPLIDEDGLEQPDRIRPKGRDSVHSADGEDITHYFVLKKKFDQIHVFIARIAGLLSKSIQECRRRHASPQLKSSYSQTNSDKAENIKKWLTNSPSKAQVDHESRRFYLKFKKRFESSRIF